MAISGTTIVVGAVAASDTVAADEFGNSVAISGATAVVGARIPAKVAGRAYVFAETASGWRQVAELKGSDTVASDGFGSSVAISGTTAIVSAQGYAKGLGRAYVFTKTGAGWKQTAELKGSHMGLFGNSVAISGTTAVVSATAYESYSPNVIGRAYVFAKTATGWKQIAELKGPHTGLFGNSVAISGMTVMVGAPDANNAGRTYVFEA